MAHYSFLTLWRIQAPLPAVWNAIHDVERWPTWWRGVERVLKLEPALEENDVGSRYSLTWKGRLPSRLTFESRVTRVIPLVAIESKATGDLEGTGRWQLLEEGSVTTVRYDWNVRTTKSWMNLLVPVGRALFQWNHDWIMRQGEKGLGRILSLAVR